MEQSSRGSNPRFRTNIFQELRPFKSALPGLRSSPSATVLLDEEFRHFEQLSRLDRATDAHAKAGQRYSEEASRYLIEEAQLFIDAAHSCNSKLSMAAVGA